MICVVQAALYNLPIILFIQPGLVTFRFVCHEPRRRKGKHLGGFDPQTGQQREGSVEPSRIPTYKSEALEQLKAKTSEILEGDVQTKPEVNNIVIDGNLPTSAASATQALNNLNRSPQGVQEHRVPPGFILRVATVAGAAIQAFFNTIYLNSLSNDKSAPDM